MITVDFMPMDVTAYLLCRRGRNVYRKVRIDIGMRQAVYNALPQCSLEVVDATGHIWSRADIKENRGRIILDYKGPPKGLPDPDKKRKEDKEQQERMDRKAVQNEAAQALKIETKARKEADKVKQIAVRKLQQEIDDFEVKNEGTTPPKDDQRTEAKDNDDMQQVGGERSEDGETLRRAVHLQVPLVGKVDARLVRPSERGSKSGSDGLHSDDDEPNVLDNRHAPRVSLVSPADEDAGRD